MRGSTGILGVFVLSSTLVGCAFDPPELLGDLDQDEVGDPTDPGQPDAPAQPGDPAPPQDPGDPTLITVIFQDGLGYTGTVDTFLDGLEPWRNRGGSKELIWDRELLNGRLLQASALVSFKDIIGTDPGQIPPNATIMSARLVTHLVKAGNGGPGTMTRADRAWDEQTTSLSYSQTGKDGDDGNGSDSDDSPDPMLREAPYQPDDGTTASSTIDVLEDVQAWVDGARNRGWIFTPNNSNDVRIASSEADNPDERPRLEVQFLMPGSAVP